MTLQSSGARLTATDEVTREIAQLAPWFHNLHLPSGHETAPDHPLGDFPAYKWAQIADAIPQDLSGVRALDIGCNAGFYSFALAARGASVVAIDADPHYLEQARWAARQLDPEQRVSFRQCQVYELGRSPDQFDLVLFLGVLYHLRYPLLALDLIAELTRGRVIVQTLTMPSESNPYFPPVPPDLPIDERERLNDPGWPRAAFIEHQLAGDPTNWWAADDACVQAMLRSAGLRVLDAPGHEFYVCEPAAPTEDHAAPFRQAEMQAALGLAES
jgi:tRNA (mo5U34)-methyltransferase